MCGFGDSWIMSNKSDSEEAFPFESSTEQPEMGPAIIIFIKNPEKGKVKTRLAGDIGEDEALKWYLHMLNHTRETAILIDAKRYLYYSSFIDQSDDWPSEQFEKHLQPSGDLGERMAAAFQQAFKDGHRQVLIVGSDCLDLRKHHLESAFSTFHEHDFVLGPANDGGYYLLGMNQYSPNVFEGIEWSTESVLQNTLDIIQSMGKTAGLLEELTDIDYESDLKASLNRAATEE